jgi:single-strand DNA-binding protein
MAEGLNRVMLLGNLGADPELRFGQGADQAVLKLRLATTESYFDKRSNERKERTDWHNVVLFGKRAEALHKILAKGSTIFIEGRLQTSSYEKEGKKMYKTDVIATNVILTGRGGGGAPREQGAAAPRSTGGVSAERPNFAKGGQAPAAAGPADDEGFDAGGGGNDDDIPF